MNPNRGRSRPSRIRLGIILALSLFALGLSSIAGSPRAGEPSCPACEIRGRWLVLDGFWQRSERWSFRHPSAQQAALRIGLPGGAWLGSSQYLLKDGSAVLQWSEPAGARTLLAADSAYLASLESLPAGAWLAFLTGEGLAAYMVVERSEQGKSRRTVIIGELAGRPARLEERDGRCRRLLWGGPDGPLVCRWREMPEGRWRILDLRSRGNPLIQLRMRPPRARALSPQEWLFLSG